MRLGMIGLSVLATAVSSVAMAGADTAAALPPAVAVASPPAAAAQPAVLPTVTSKLRPTGPVGGKTGVAAALPGAGTAAIAPVAAAATISRGDFNALPPTRTLDTRTGLGSPRVRLGAGRTITVQITGRTGVPATGVAGVLMTVTASTPTAPGYLTVYPAGGPRPVAAALYFATGQTASNLALARLSATGQVTIFNSGGTVDVVATLSGWYATTATVHPLTPVRLLDTRFGTGAPAGTIPLNGTRVIQVTGRGGVPATGVTGAVVNLSSIGATASGSMALYPTGAAPGAGNLLVPSSTAISNLAYVQLGTGGAITLVNRAGSAHATVEVVGWIAAGGQFHPLAERRYDTRPAGASGPLATNSWFDFWMTGIGRVPAMGVNAMTMNITVIAPSANGQLLIEPQGNITPVATSISYTKGRTTSTLITVKIGRGGWIRFNNAGGSVHLILDTVGWYSADGSVGLAVGQTVSLMPYQATAQIQGVTDDGRYSFFRYNAALTPYADLNSLYVRDSLLGITQVTISGFWTPEKGQVSADGRYLTFQSASPNLWAGDTNAATDVFRYDTTTNALSLVTATSAGTPGNAGGVGATMSANGRFAIFESSSTGIAAGQTAGVNAFVRNLTTGSTVRIGDCGARLQTCVSDVSDDGSVALFVSDLPAEGPRLKLWRRSTGLTTEIPFVAQGFGGHPAFSADGTMMAFSTDASLLPADPGPAPDIYTRNLTTGATTLFGIWPTGDTLPLNQQTIGVSADGARVMFPTNRDLLGQVGTLTPWVQYYRASSAGGPPTLVTKNQAGVPANGETLIYEWSANLNWLVVDTRATNLGGDLAGAWRLMRAG